MNKRFLIILFLLIASVGYAQDGYVDSLYDVLKTHPQEDTIRAKTLFKILYEEFEVHPEKSKALADELLRMSRNLAYPKGESVAFRYMTEYYINIGEHNEATRCAYEMRKAGERANYQRSVARSYQLMGDIKEAEHDFKNAKLNYEKAIELFQGNGSVSDLAYGYSSLAGLYYNFGKIDLATQQHLKALNLMLASGDEHGIGIVYGNLGELYKVRKDFTSALVYMEKALAIAEREGNTFLEANVNSGIGEVNMMMGKADIGEPFLLKSVAQAKEVGNKHILEDSYRLLSDLEKRRGAFDAALHYAKLESAYRDSIYSDAKAKQIADADSRYAVAKKDDMIQSLERANRLRQASMYVLIAVLVLVVMIFVVVYLFQRVREQKNMKAMNLQVDNLKLESTAISEKLQNTLARVDEAALESQDQRLLKKAIEVIEANISDALFGVDKMAIEVGMSRATLNRRLKTITGFPPGELIRNIRLRKAALLLRNKSDNVSQVSFAVGFEDQSYFSKSFKKHFGMPPSEYAAKNWVSTGTVEEFSVTKANVPLQRQRYLSTSVHSGA